MRKTGETVAAQFAISDPETGGLVDADASPTAVLVIDGVTDSATVTVTKPGTGIYKASVVLPEVTDGQTLQIRVAATVATVAGGGIIWAGEGCTKRPADLVDAPVLTDYQQRGQPVTLPATGVTLAAAQDLYAPAKAGDEMAVSVATVAAIAAAVWAATTRTLTSWGTLATTVAAAVWAYATRTLTAPAAGEVTPVGTTALTLRRGDSWTQSITGLGSLAARTALIVTVKYQASDLDAAAVLQISEADGLEVLLGDDPADAVASLTVTDEAAGDVTLVISAEVTALLSLTQTQHPLIYDVQLITATGVQTLILGTLAVVYDVTRRTV